jgi:hypothetical protein
MPDITCPECGQVTRLVTVRRAADEFCSHCDFPLFWARVDLPVEEGAVTASATLRRLPGAGGRMTIGTKVCPACGELNPMANTHCIRCAADLDPRPPEPAPPPPPPPPPPPEPEPVVEQRTPWWIWALVVALFVVVAVVVVVVVS